MRLVWKLAASSAIILLPAMSRAVSCTSQAELAPADRSALSTEGNELTQAILARNYGVLQSSLLPGEASQWSGIQAAAQDAQTLMQGGQIKLEDAYLLDATSQTGPADAEFFCSGSSGNLMVTMTMRQLPPGKYAVILADSVGAPLGGRLGLVLAWENAPPAGWKLAGLSAHQGIFDGHDGVWYWSRARTLANPDPWSAWYSYDLARYMLLPVTFITSPNLQKLDSEQADIKNSPRSAFPYSVPDGPRTWKIDSMTLDTVLHEPDLAVVYESTGVTTPAAQHTEALAVLSALLKAQPGLRANFHGLWAVASYNGKQTPIIELPMAQIPAASGQ
ncbi:MAG TPA: hypothetical protein VN579_01410 [Bryobacteraceae bacterium]|nr:hypothetical protein [Bryobacteraceae bacterium]